MQHLVTTPWTFFIIITNVYIELSDIQTQILRNTQCNFCQLGMSNRFVEFFEKNVSSCVIKQ